MLTDQFVMKIVNVLLRVTSLAAKLVLTLYMGRYLGLEDLGVYGLVFATVMFGTVFLGIRIDYTIARELVGAGPLEILTKVRDQSVFLFANYVIFAIIMLLLTLLGVAPASLMLVIFLLSITESLANNYTTNLTAVGRPVLSTLLFFIRAGLWCFIVAAMGILDPAMRTVEVVLIGWGVGEAISLALCFLLSVHMPWREVVHIPVNWGWIKEHLKRCYPIWLGTLGAAAALMIDRFIVSYFMDLKEVGVITFYGSFATALLALVQSGFYSFSYPKMIEYHKEGKVEAFWEEAWQVGWQAALFVAATGICVGVVIPFSAPFFQKPELAEHALTLWLILGSIWIRANADTLYYVLYARNQDWALWVGSLLFLIPALLGNLIFVPMIGLPGVGVSAILAAIFLLIWRLVYAVSGK